MRVASLKRVGLCWLGRSAADRVAATRADVSQAVSASCLCNQNFCPPSGSDAHLQIWRAPRSAATWVDVIDDKSSLLQIMTWHQIGTKPLSEPIMTQSTDTFNDIFFRLGYAQVIASYCFTFIIITSCPCFAFNDGLVTLLSVCKRGFRGCYDLYHWPSVIRQGWEGNRIIVPWMATRENIIIWTNAG